MNDFLLFRKRFSGAVYFECQQLPTLTKTFSGNRCITFKTMTQGFLYVEISKCIYGKYTSEVLHTIHLPIPQKAESFEKLATEIRKHVPNFEYTKPNFNYQASLA